MMRCKCKIIAALAVAVLLAMPAVPLHAAGGPVAVTADTIDYDANSGVITARGGVEITRDGAVLTGAYAEYNTKAKQAHVTGGVRVEKDGAVLTAPEVFSYDDNHIVAQDNVVLTKEDKRLTGQHADYYTDRQYALVTGDARLTSSDAVMTAPQIEAYFNEDRAVGSGGVHIVSDTRHIDATGNTGTYYGPKTGRERMVLEGNARAVQEGNVLTGQTLTIYADEKTIDATGRPRLIITPTNS